MTESGLALRYARALLAEACRRQEGEAVREDLVRAEKYLAAGGKDLAVRLGHPLLSAEARLAVLEKKIAWRAATSRDFLRLLLVRRRIALLPSVRRLYERMYWRSRGVLPCLAETAVPPDSFQRKFLERHLRRIFRRTPRITWRVNPDLLAGVRLRAEDTVLDLSLRGMLEALKERLLV